MDRETRTERYEGLYPSQAEDACTAGSKRAARAGWFPIERKWLGRTCLLVTYAPAPTHPWGPPTASATAVAATGTSPPRSSAAATTHGPRPRSHIVAAAVVVGLVVLGGSFGVFLGIGGGLAGAGPPTATPNGAAGVAAAQRSPAVGDHKYEQTWVKSYRTTSCLDWNRRMDRHQRFVMAADLLLAARQRKERAAGLPTDPDVGRFSAGLDRRCDDTGASWKAKDRHVAGLAADLYGAGGYD